MAFSEEYFNAVEEIDNRTIPLASFGPETQKDLENDSGFQEDAETYLTFLAEDTTGWKKFTDPGSWGGQDDIFETLRDEDYRLSTIATRSSQMEEAPKEVKQAYSRLRTRWDAADIGEGRRLQALADIGTDAIADPLNLIGFLFTGGAGAAAVGTSAAAKKGVAQTLKKLAVNNTTGAVATRGAMSGATWTGVDNYYRQNTELAAGLRNQFDTTELGAMTAGGAVLGGGASGIGAALLGGSLGKYLGVTKPSKSRQATLNKAVDEDQIGDTADAEITVEVMKDTYSFAANALPPKGRTFDGEFEEVAVQKAAEETAKKYKGGERTKGELYDAVRQVIKENQGATGEQIQSLLRQKVGRTLHGMSPTRMFIEKPASILDSYTKYSKTAATLQKKFRYDLGRPLRGKSVLTDSDFFETFSAIRGERLNKVNDALDPIKLELKGDALDEAKQNIAKILRGGEVEGADELYKAASSIRGVLDDIADDLVGFGIMDKAAENYVPRMWDRKRVLNERGELADLLVRNKVTYSPKGKKEEILLTQENVNEFIDSMLDIENRLDVAGGGASFFSSRTLNILDEEPFEEFLDNNLDSLLNAYTAQTSKTIAKTKVFGVRDIQGFKDLWVDQIGKEMKQAGQKAFTRKEQEAILNTYKIATGEGVEKYSDVTQASLDTYVLGTRIALLPLATLSSLTEIALNISKAGLKDSTVGFAKAFKTALTTVTDDTVEDLVNKGLTRSEAFKEMNSVSIAMDQALADGAERLSGEALTANWQRKVNNGFFKYNLLDGWTKAVQLTSFTTAKEIINTNLGKIAATIDAPTARTQSQIDQLTDLGIDVKKALEWYNAGAKRSDDFYKNDVIKAAGRYTNEIILNPSPEAGIKPNIMSHPKTSVLFQLMGYPAAFTNVILKNFITSTIKDPVGNLPKVAGTAIVMTGMAAAANYIRSHGESTKDKSMEEVIVDSVQRWGGVGLAFDQAQRARDASKYYQSTVALGTGAFGPIVGDVYKAVKLDALARAFGTKGIPYTAIKPILGEEAKKDYDNMLYKIDKKIFNLTVPERDDTSSIYKKRYNSGGIVEFFKVPNAPEVPRERVDKLTGKPYEEQAKDPLERLGFSIGGKLVSKIGKALKELSIIDLSDDAAQKAADDIKIKAQAYSDTRDVDEEIIESRVRSVMEGTSFTDPKDIDYDIEQVIDALGARERPEDAFIKARSLYNFSDSIRKNIDSSPENEQIKLKKAIDLMRTSNDEDFEGAAKTFSRLLFRMPKSANPVMDTQVPDNKAESIRQFLKGSKIKVPVFRGTGDGINTDFEINFAFPREIGPHFGTQDQAQEILDRGVRIPHLAEGYLNLKNPLVIDEDYGSWDAVNLLTSPADLDNFSKMMAKQLPGQTFNRIKNEIIEQVKPSIKTYFRISNKIDDKMDSDLYTLAKHVANAQSNIILKKYLQSKGFDSLKYKNKGESLQGKKYSYIPFEPQQFKKSNASRFDPNDPRASKYSGGKILKSLSFR